MANVLFTAFLSCSFEDEDKELVDLFKRIIRSFDIDAQLYDYQEMGRVPDKVKEHIVRCDCLIAIATRREKKEGSEQWTCPDWIQHEMAVANASGKPVAIFFEEGVSIGGLIGMEERRQKFVRDKIVQDIDKITTFLFNLRNYLDATYRAEFLQGPVLLRHYIRAKEEVRSAEEAVMSCKILMESLIEELESTDHALELQDTTPGLSTKPKQFDFMCIQKPEDMKVEPEILMETDQKFLWKVVFDPPLRRGEKVEYAFKIVRPNHRPYTYEEMEERIRQGTYEYKEPICEACEWLVSYPAAELDFESEFPEGYEIAKFHPDVRIGESRLHADKEVKRIQEGNLFTAQRLFDKWALRLKVPKPLQGHTYYTYYEPPKSA